MPFHMFKAFYTNTNGTANKSTDGDENDEVKQDELKELIVEVKRQLVALKNSRLDSETAESAVDLPAVVPPADDPPYDVMSFVGFLTLVAQRVMDIILYIIIASFHLHNLAISERISIIVKYVGPKKKSNDKEIKNTLFSDKIKWHFCEDSIIPRGFSSIK